MSKESREEEKPSLSCCCGLLCGRSNSIESTVAVQKSGDAGRAAAAAERVPEEVDRLTARLPEALIRSARRLPLVLQVRDITEQEIITEIQYSHSISLSSFACSQLWQLIRSRYIIFPDISVLTNIIFKLWQSIAYYFNFTLSFRIRIVGN